MTDTILLAVCRDAQIKASAITSRNMVEKARHYHRTLPLATAALGRALSAGSLFGAQLKTENESVTLQIKGGGPLGSIVVVSDHLGNVRGYLQNPAADLPLKANGKLDVGRGVGNDGFLTLIRDMGMREPFVGTVELVSGEIAEDVTAYLAQSEQVPSACELGVLLDTDQSVRAAGGYIVQLMPGVTQETAERLEASVARAGAVTAMLDRGLNVEELLLRVLEGFDVEILERRPVEYRCNCSQERVLKALVSLGRTELAELAEKQESVEVCCQFCDKQYRFSAEELIRLTRAASGPANETEKA